MNYSEFCHNFYTGSKTTSGLKNTVSQRDIVQFFLEAALGAKADEKLVLSDSTFSKWYSGDRMVPVDLWEEAAIQFDENNFTSKVEGKLNDNALDLLFQRFGIDLYQGETPDKYALSNAIAKQFKLMVEGSGEADNVVPQIYRELGYAEEFPTYIQNSYDKYSKLKTLLYTSSEHPFDEFFVCNYISLTRHGGRNNSGLIKEVTLEKLLEKAQYSLLVGMGGIGKSMMMRHLFLESNQLYHETGLLPILVTLREFGSEKNNLFDLIVESVRRFDLSFSTLNARQFLTTGRCQILLDGMDEIKMEDMQDFQHQLEILVDMYPQNQYVMSTRRFSKFVGLSRFTTMWVRPFNRGQALELIDKLIFCPEEPKLKQQFRDLLKNELFITHREFVTNPLLLTLMLMNYHRFAEVPEKKYLFYEQAYQTLLQRHDADKLAYKRVFHSVSDTSDFTLVFREFCAKSYRHGDYEFDDDTFNSYFECLKSRQRLNLPDMTAENFLYDVCNSACLMFEEGNSYHFLHRSFQEYFFADYYSRQDDTTIRRLGVSLDSIDRHDVDNSDALDMLYDLAPDKVEKFIFMPFLEKIFNSEEKENEYWRFLSATYGYWRYFVINKKIDCLNSKNLILPSGGVEPSSDIFALILRILKHPINLDVELDVEELLFDECIRFIVYAEKVDRGNDEIRYFPRWSLSKDIPDKIEFMKRQRFYDRIFKDSNEEPIEVAYECVFDFEDAILNPEYYTKIIELWKNQNSEVYTSYEIVKQYYFDLKEKISEYEDMGDDDF